MHRPEYLELTRSPEPGRNLRVSVKFSDGAAMIAPREFPFEAFLAAVEATRMEMDFDAQPHRITRFDVDFEKATLKIYASAL